MLDGVEEASKARRKTQLQAASARWRAKNRDAIAAKNAEFYAANRERELARAAEYRAANPEKAKASTIAWRAANADRHAATKKAYRLNNAEQLIAQRKAAYTRNKVRENAQSSAYKRVHADRLAAQQAARLKADPTISRYARSKRRAAEKKALPHWANSAAMREFYVTADALSMWTGDWYHVDHIVPLQSRSVCGLHCEANLRVLPGSDNQAKGNRHWPDMP